MITCAYIFCILEDTIDTVQPWFSLHYVIAQQSHRVQRIRPHPRHHMFQQNFHASLVCTSSKHDFMIGFCSAVSTAWRYRSCIGVRLPVPLAIQHIVLVQVIDAQCCGVCHGFFLNIHNLFVCVGIMRIYIQNALSSK